MSQLHILINKYSCINHNKDLTPAYPYVGPAQLHLIKAKNYNLYFFEQKCSSLLSKNTFCSPYLVSEVSGLVDEFFDQLVIKLSSASAKAWLKLG